MSVSGQGSPNYQTDTSMYVSNKHNSLLNPPFCKQCFMVSKRPLQKYFVRKSARQSFWAPIAPQSTFLGEEGGGLEIYGIIIKKIIQNNPADTKPSVPRLPCWPCWRLGYRRRRTCSSSAAWTTRQRPCSHTPWHRPFSSCRRRYGKRPYSGNSSLL